MEQDNSALVVAILIRLLGVKVTRQSVLNELEKHPDYPSMLAISDVLNNWKIPNAAYSLHPRDLSEVPAPFIAHLGGVGTNGEFVVVTRYGKEEVIVSSHIWKNHVMKLEEFTYRYTGSILVAQADADSGEQHYSQKRRKEILQNFQTPFLITGALLVLFVLLLQQNFFTSISGETAARSVLKALGFVTSMLLIMQSVDENNPMIRKLCGSDKRKGCNAILSSKAASLFGVVSWSEIGFFYFAGSLIVLLFNSTTTPVLSLLAWLNLVSLPYTFYSIYYQARVARQWCVLCCAAQGLLWLEFILFLPFLKAGLMLPSPMAWASLFIGFMLPVLAWVFAKPLLLQVKQLSPLKRELRTFKFNRVLFEQMLQQEPKYALAGDNHSIVLGKKEAEHTVTMVSNPFCQPCSKAHQALDEWVETREGVKLQIVFSVADDERKFKSKVAGHLMALKALNNNTLLKEALNNWYQQPSKNYEAWAQRYPAAKSAVIDEMVQKQHEWCTMTNVESTPTFFINGRKLPSVYAADDIKYFL